ncbi:TPA: hypothetical protein ACH3X2_012821 [Trebouxia sp. C0005]|nr:MAG: hypothetical protein FRX49_07238 [Trebouxia sp. A1-2]
MLRHGRGNYTLSQLRKHLVEQVASGNWNSWVSSLPNHTPEELAMSKGPHMSLTLWNHLEIQGNRFLTSRVEGSSKKACDSLVLTWFTDTTQTPHFRQPYVGQVQSFMTHHPPWAVGKPAERETQVAQLAWVKWFGYRGRNQNVYTAFVYTRAFVPEVDGDIWACEMLEPVPIALAPYYGAEFAPQEQLQQVLVCNVAVFKENIDYTEDLSLLQGV